MKRSVLRAAAASGCGGFLPGPAPLPKIEARCVDAGLKFSATDPYLVPLRGVMQAFSPESP